MTTTEPNTTPSSLPGEIEQAIRDYYDAVRRFAADGDRATYKAAYEHLRHAILKALNETQVDDMLHS